MLNVARFQQRSLPAQISRRDFLRATGGVGIGLIVSAYVPGFAGAADAPKLPTAQAVAQSVAAFIKIGPDNTVTVVSKHLEMGQGPYTGLATLVAEEMDADWSQIRAAGGGSNPELYKNFVFGMQGTGGSSSIANSYEQMRKVGATARAMLVAAAAQEWSVPASEISVSKGVVRSTSGKHATFGELAERAAQMPAPTSVKLKDPKQFALIGKPLGKLDSAVKSTGKAIYTIDVHAPEMLTVVVAHPSRFDAKVASVDDSAARKVRGVVDVKVIPQGVAVYATGFWAAKKGRDALKITWDETDTETRSTDQLLVEYRSQAKQQAATATHRGNVESAFGKASKIIQAEYVFPYLAHAPLEPLDCTIAMNNGACHAAFGSQLQTVDHMAIAKVMALDPSKVSIETLLAGGSFGRRAQPTGDLAAEAAAALKALGRDAAIKLVWTREDDIRGGRYRPFTLHNVRAGLDKSGRIVAWDHSVASQSIFKGTPFEMMMKEGVDPSMVEGLEDLPYAVPNLRVGAQIMEVRVPVLWWRSVGNTHTAYVKETFIDEVLLAGGKDPLQGRLALLNKDRRHTGVLQAVAKLANWKGANVGGGRARGIAVHKSFDSYVAQIAEVSRGADGVPKVEHVWCAVDCGVAVNPEIIKAQMEGGIGYGLGAILYNEITLDKGRVQQSNFNNYRMLRINEMPKVDVTVVASAEKPTGVGEPGVPPIGPAVANAWRALTGTSVRHLPFNRQVA